MKPKPSAAPRGWFSWEHHWGCAAPEQPQLPGRLRQVDNGRPLPVTQVLFLRSELCGLTRIFRFDVNFGGAVADNLQEARLEDLMVPSSLPPYMIGKHHTKSLSQACHELVHLFLIKEMAVLIKCTSFGV